MSIVHPITEQLRMERVRRRITINQLAKETGVSRNTISAHEEFKFTALHSLEKWARALGYEITLRKFD